MNERIKELEEQAWNEASSSGSVLWSDWRDKFASLIIDDCNNIISDLYRQTPLELCGPLLTASEEIMAHFYEVKNDKP